MHVQYIPEGFFQAIPNAVDIFKQLTLLFLFQYTEYREGTLAGD